MGKQGNETVRHKYYIEKHREKELVLCFAEYHPRKKKKNAVFATKKFDHIS